MLKFVTLFCYRGLCLIASPIILLLLIIRAKTKHDVFSLERFGFVPKTDSKNYILWFHAASVGETLSLQYLIKKLESNNKTIRCYLTVGTSTAKQVARSFQDPKHLSYVPYDFFFSSVTRTLKRIKPHALIITEGEFWPNLIMTTALRNVPVYSLNSKISFNSYKRFKKISWLTNPLLSSFKSFLAQSKEMQERFSNLSSKKTHIHELGNLKAYNVWAKKQITAPSSLTFHDPVLLVGSIHPGELDTYISLYQALREENIKMKLIIAPRHFHWQEEIKKKLFQASLSYTLWNNEEKSKETQLKSLDNKDVLIICVLGHLFDLYQYSTIFYLGGTFVPVGGHNLLEPAVWGTSIIIGPYYENCKTEANLLEAENALIKVKNTQELIEKTIYLLKNQNKIQKMQNNASSWLKKTAQKVEENIEKQLSSIL